MLYCVESFKLTIRRSPSVSTG